MNRYPNSVISGSLLKLCSVQNEHFLMGLSCASTQQCLCVHLFWQCLFSQHFRGEVDQALFC